MCQSVEVPILTHSLRWARAGSQNPALLGAVESSSDHWVCGLTIAASLKVISQRHLRCITCITTLPGVPVVVGAMAGTVEAVAPARHRGLADEAEDAAQIRTHLALPRVLALNN